MFRPVHVLATASLGFLISGSAVPSGAHAVGGSPAVKITDPSPPVAAPPARLAPPATPVAPAPPSPPTVREVLDQGVLIVISKPSQKAFVFKDGELWGSSAVSTGRPGYDTPAGVFPILQKRVDHRSNLYDDAPMPYMQRLTWGGVALHAGNVPGYPASHGCIRLPTKFARELYEITGFSSTAVLIANEPIGTAEEARMLGGGGTATVARAGPVRTEAPAAGQARTQTIQLTASQSAENAAALWNQLLQRQPALAELQHAIIPATVGGRKVFRLRASGPRAGSICSSLTQAGVPCLRVRD